MQGARCEEACCKGRDARRHAARRAMRGGMPAARIGLGAGGVGWRRSIEGLSECKGIAGASCAHWHSCCMPHVLHAMARRGGERGISYII
jgi:hypothetical protein